ncbi:pyrroline-5-carboxylate reductase [Roseibium denhamense]|uniref:Pyrroline-5-carboxylate reductase n=1 Tax=Roseibium denhamense TaxID=76305 RepID=A0ABY1NF03_9HYPH|nr:pyrroline-5-carboxylate reductase [Roseibium denhamense]MTI04136.1 pyrroline-5-carboxylate reductase [Roseibium denhamense]SMP08032.1 pyrroline-5-carboxylate reductase [Roseibium denhamense]
MIFSKERPFLLVGAGKMGGAMLSGWMAEGIDPAAIIVCDPQPSDDMVAFLSAKGIRHVTAVPDDVTAGIVLVAVKPQMMDRVLPGLKSAVSDDTLVMSVAAGTPVSKFTSVFGNVPVARCMPNTPSMVGRGITAVYPTGNVSDAQKTTIGDLLSAVGKVVWLDKEEQIDLVTGVSGSGPAYVFFLAEALSEAGKAAGLPDALAEELAFATVCGAGELMHQSADHPAQLRKNVTSPNGTTAAALDVLMHADGMQPVMTKAVAAAVARARDLSN